MIFLLLLQATAAPAPPADLHLAIRARAKSVRVEQKGTSYLRLLTVPDGGNLIDVQAPPVDRDASNVTVAIDARARIADPAAEPPSPRPTPE